MKITLLNDTECFENIGCQLTSARLKHKVTESITGLGEEVELECYPWKWGVRARRVHSFFSSLPFLMGRKEGRASFLRWLKVLSKNEYGRDAYHSSLNADLVVFQPEGSFYESDDILKLISILSLPILCQRIGKPVLCLNGTFPEHPDSRAEFIKSFFRSSRWVALRDRRSAEFYGTDFLPDLAFSYQALDSVPVGSTTPSDSVLITTGAGFSKKENLKLARVALDFCHDEGLRPLVLTKLGFHLEGLRPEIESMNGRFIDLPNLYVGAELIKECCLHIGGRYHMAILAFTLSVPSVLVRTNTHKNEWLSDELLGVEIAQTFSEISTLGEKLLHQGDQAKADMAEDLERMKLIIESDIPRQLQELANCTTTPPRKSKLNEQNGLHNHLTLSSMAGCLYQDQKIRLNRSVRNIRRKLLLTKNKVYPHSILGARQN